VAVLAVIGPIALLTTGAQASTKTHASQPEAARVTAMLRGIPQHGPWLGRKDAPLTLVEYVDVQCPYCARFSHDVFPAVVRKYVAPA
jgi:protein-disulfide isomerase